PRMLFTARPAPDGSRSFLFMGMHQSLGAFSLVTVEGHEASRGVDDPVRKLQILLLSQQRQSFFAGFRVAFRLQGLVQQFFSFVGVGGHVIHHTSLPLETIIPRVFLPPPPEKPLQKKRPAEAGRGPPVRGLRKEWSGSGSPAG